MLNKLAGQRMPESFGKIPAQFTDVTKEPLLGCKLKFQQLRRSRACRSPKRFPHLQKHADKLAVIRSCYHDAFNHSPAQYVLTTGQSRLGYPSVGAWVTYGLGSESRQPAGDGRDDRARRQGEGRHAAAGATASCPRSTRARRCRRSGTPILYLEPPAGRHRARASGRCSTSPSG